MDRELEGFMVLLRKEGYKVTPQRIAILKVLIGNRSHPSAQQICEKVRQEHPMISLATVYKTLDLLKDLGEVMELGFSNQSTRYDPDVEPHLNLICLQCGDIYNLYDSSLDGIRDTVENDSDFEITCGRFELYGICGNCRADAVRLSAAAR